MTGRSTQWWALNRPYGVVWYALSRYRRDLDGWLVFPGLVAEDLEDDSWEATIMSVLRKTANKGPVGPVRFTPTKEEAKRWPGLLEHLTVDRWPETGEVRKTSTLTFFFGAQGLTGVLSDKEMSIGCFANAVSLVGLLDELEAAVQNPATVWREDRQATGSSARVKRTTS
jgi:hypothetical protein